MRIGRNAILVLFVLMVTASAAVSFTLFGFRSAADIANNQVFKWAEAPARTPFVMTYAFADDFMAGQADITQQEARDAVVRALNTWSEGTGGFITFEPALWGVIENGSSDFSCCPFDPAGVSPPAQFFGPPLDEWLADMSLPVPGWGTHIDFFTKPSNFSIWSQVITNAFHMTPPGQGSVLGFSLVTRSGTKMLVSDIYLNSDFSWDDDGSNFDLETIVLHEVGHVLGLDHPNQAAANGAVNLDPFTFEAGANVCPCDVMHSTYTGSKRELTDDELGGLAFLYRAGAGDLDGDQAVTLADVSMALPFASGSAPNPYELWTLDFLNENGRVDAAELAIMGQWASGTLPYAPDGSTILRGNPTPAPGEIILTATPSPTDIGKGGTVEIDVFIGNPNQFQVMAWEFELAYDTGVLSNPACTPGTFPAMSLKTADDTDDGVIETFNIAFNPDTASTGLLATFTFDVNLLAAVGAVNTAVTLNNAAVVVDVNGEIRNYGIDGSEVVTINDAMLFASDMDANADGMVSLDDLYAWHLSPIDVNQDGMTDDADRTFLAECLREGELTDILPPAGN